MAFENKLVLIINKDIDIGVALNGAAHISLALGALLGQNSLALQDYKDASGNCWPISGMPYIILRGKSGEIRKAVLAAKEAGILHLPFTETMTKGTFEDQLERTSKIQESDHVFYGAAIYGPWDSVSHLTRKFSLYK
jgi:hypothetical protein